MQSRLDVRNLARPLAALALMVCAAVAATTLRPVSQPSAKSLGVSLSTVVPQQFGEWRVDTSIVPIAPPPDVQASLEKIYSQVLARTYVDDSGRRIMLSIAYGDGFDRQLDVHRPEYCYPAQGFTVGAFSDVSIEANQRALPVRRLVARMRGRNEPITYWVTIGDSAVASTFRRKLIKIKQGLTGQIGSGMLVRVSSIDRDEVGAYALQQQFIDAMLRSLSPGARKQVVGTT